MVGVSSTFQRQAALTPEGLPAPQLRQNRPYPRYERHPALAILRGWRWGIMRKGRGHLAGKAEDRQAPHHSLQASGRCLHGPGHQCQPRRAGSQGRPGLTAGTAGGLWTSWVRLWSASPWMMPPPQIHAWPLAKEPQDEDCHREQWSGRPGQTWLCQVGTRPQAAGWGSEKAVDAWSRGYTGESCVSESFTASASNAHTAHTHEKTLKWGQDLSLPQAFQKNAYQIEGEYEM